MVEFIDLRHGGISVLEYSLKFTTLSRYAPSFVYDPRDRMNLFVKVVSDYMHEK